MKICATEGCVKAATGKSKYCPEHKREARARWKAMIAAKGDAKAEREAGHRSLYEAADAAGKVAAELVTPVPMIVAGHEDDPVEGGVCGFAWINVRPGNSSFARWLKKEGLGDRDSHRGGIMVWVGAYGQSMTRKEAYATAFAETLRKAGVTAYAQSRMD